MKLKGEWNDWAVYTSLGLIAVMILNMDEIWKIIMVALIYVSTNLIYLGGKIKVDGKDHKITWSFSELKGELR